MECSFRESSTNQERISSIHKVADRYAAEALSSKTVGNLPIKLSRLCSIFIDQGGDIALSHTVFTISHATISNGAQNRVDFNIATCYLTRLLIPCN